ncbi:MAG: hypothetical protein LBO20_07180, partial [Bifidobacteriaceae bacterium]|nr:hypothetical protein [Bifidobacteriaceae bacterium]
TASATGAAAGGEKALGRDAGRQRGEVSCFGAPISVTCCVSSGGVALPSVVSGVDPGIECRPVGADSRRLSPRWLPPPAPDVVTCVNTNMPELNATLGTKIGFSGDARIENWWLW